MSVAVEAELNYTGCRCGEEAPRLRPADPPPGVPHSNSTLEPRRFAIRDMRPVAARISLDSHGFAALRHRSALRYFDDEDQIRRTYYPEAEALLKEATGASRVLIFDRPHDPAPYPWHRRPAQPGSAARPRGARRPDREVRPATGTRPAPGRSRRAPARPRPDRQSMAAAPRTRPGCLLAACDNIALSMAPEDLLASDPVYRADRIGETYSVTYNPAHRWFLSLGDDPR